MNISISSTRFILLFALVGACASWSSTATTLQSEKLDATHQSDINRFTGVSLLGGSEFAHTIVDRGFRYRISSEIVVDQPREIFIEGGRYELHRSRSVTYGTYSIKGGIVSIVGAGPFLGLSTERVFFRDGTKLLTSSADGSGPVIELIPLPDKEGDNVAQ